MTAVDLGEGGGVLTNTAFASVASIAAIAMAAKNVLLIFILVPLCGRSRLRGFSTLPSGPDVSIYPDGAWERSVREFIGLAVTTRRRSSAKFLQVIVPASLPRLLPQRQEPETIADAVVAPLADCGFLVPRLLTLDLAATYL